MKISWVSVNIYKLDKLPVPALVIFSSYQHLPLLVSDNGCYANLLCFTIYTSCCLKVTFTGNKTDTFPEGTKRCGMEWHALPISH